MGSMSNKVGALKGSVIVFMKWTDAFEIVCGNIREQLAELTSVMKTFLPTSSLSDNGQTTILQPLIEHGALVMPVCTASCMMAGYGHARHIF
jgi:hypothetical protein